MTKQPLKPREQSLSRCTAEYQRLLQTLRKRGHQPWVKPAHERKESLTPDERPSIEC